MSQATNPLCGKHTSYGLSTQRFPWGFTSQGKLL
jgi:hypothetical protein